MNIAAVIFVIVNTFHIVVGMNVVDVVIFVCSFICLFILVLVVRPRDTPGIQVVLVLMQTGSSGHIYIVADVVLVAMVTVVVTVDPVTNVIG